MCSGDCSKKTIQVSKTRKAHNYLRYKTTDNKTNIFLYTHQERGKGMNKFACLVKRVFQLGFA